MRAILRGAKRWVLEQDFSPGFWGQLVNPFYFTRRDLLRILKATAPSISGRTLDVGCGSKPYAHLTRASEYVGLEVEGAGTGADVYYDGKTFPFPDSSFDSVVSFQVLEHVPSPAHSLAEIHRVLRSGGTLLLSVPFVWDEHLQPHDFYRFTSFGARALLETSGFEVRECHKSLTDLRAVAQLLACFLQKRLHGSGYWKNVLATMLFIAPVNLAATLLYRLFGENPDLYLNLVLIARKR